MPSPLAHTVTGYAVWRLARAGSEAGPFRRHAGFPALLYCLGASMLPDVDFLPGVLIGNAGVFHNHAMSGILTAVAVCLGVALLARALTGAGLRPAFLLALTCYWLHLLMDYLTVSRGMMLLWPFTTSRFQAPLRLFYGVRWTQGWFTTHHLWMLLNEIVFVIALLALVWAVERRSARLCAGS